MPDEYHFTGMSMNAPMPANSTMLRRACAAISRRRMPRIAPLRKMFSRPVSSGWKPGADLDQRGERGRGQRSRPSVGAVMPASSLRIVLLPAPLRPMMPSVSPRATSKLTSRSAQNSRRSLGSPSPLRGADRRPPADSACRRRAAGDRRGVRRSDDIGHRRFELLEDDSASGTSAAVMIAATVQRSGIEWLAEDRAAEAVDEAGHRVEQVPARALCAAPRSAGRGPASANIQSCSATVSAMPMSRNA